MLQVLPCCWLLWFGRKGGGWERRFDSAAGPDEGHGFGFSELDYKSLVESSVVSHLSLQLLQQGGRQVHLDEKGLELEVRSGAEGEC